MLSRGSLLLAGLALSACSTDQFVGPDASEDASADVATDAGGDGPGAPCNPVPPACPVNHLCTSFDTGSPPEAPFSHVVTGAAAEEVSGGNYHSCPSAMKASLEQAPDDAGLLFGGIVGSIAVSAQVSPTGVLRFVVQLPSSVAAEGIGVAGISANGDNTSPVTVGYRNGSWQLLAGSHATNINPLAGKWNSMKLTVTYSVAANPGSAQLDYLDSNGQQQTANVTVDAVAVPIKSVDATLGIASAGGFSAPTEVWFDDVDLGAL